MAGKDEGRLAMTRVTLRPEIAFSRDNRPSAYQVARLHDDAHRQRGAP